MRLLLTFFSLSFLFAVHAQDSIRINEVCSRNSKIITDENENYEDWIEIYNYGHSEVDVSKYHLTDDKTKLKKWSFPKIILQPNEYLLVFASGKNTNTTVNHWESALFGDSLWHFKNPDDENNTSYDYVHWSDYDYDDTEWQTYQGAFGTPDGYEQITTETNPDIYTIYLRQEFYITDTAKLLSAMIHAFYDDGFTAYINGYEVLRINMVHNGMKPSHHVSAFRPHASVIDSGEEPEGFIIPQKYFKSLLKNGRNVFAIENHNFWSNNPQVIKPWLSFSSSSVTYQMDTVCPLLTTHHMSIHSNFKVSGDGEKLYLTDSLGVIIQKFDCPALPSNISAGLHIDFPDSIVLYSEPSPLEINNSAASASIITDSIVLQYTSGYYQDSVEIIVNNINDVFTIRYTTDGNIPCDTSNIYESSFYVDSTCVFRFQYFSDSLIAGPVSNNTYLVDESSSLEYFSIITAPHNLWDNEDGIYVFGDYYIPEAPYFEANFWQNWERDVHLQHFSADGELFWQQDAGIKIHGNWTRMLSQKSFGFYAKSEYSHSRFEHSLFSQLTHHDSYKRFLFRNAGNDNGWAFLRDLLVHTRMKHENIDIQMGKTVSSYINGEYWGLYHLREKIDRFYIQDHWGVKTDSVNLLEQNGLIISGKRNDFEDLMDFIQNNDLSNNANYTYVSSKIEIGNWINNLITNLYHHNTDWPHHNTKFWNSPQHKWRQILVDQDVTMSLRVYNQPSKNSLTRIHEDTVSYLAIIYKELLKNEDFKHEYINRFADLMNTKFLKENYIPLLDSIVAVLDPEMEKHTERWNRNYNSWQNTYIERVRTFIESKSPYMRTHLRQKYSLGTYDTITLSVDPQGKGKIRLNSIFISENNWSGLYYDSIPISIEAIPNPGFQFVEWQSNSSPQLADSGRIINKWYLKANDSITAVFYSPTGTGDTLKIAFCEINYRAYPNAEAGDWIEIINSDNHTIDLSNWTLRGGKQWKKWSIPNGIEIEPQERFVLVSDTNLFNLTHPEAENVIGPFEFGLSAQGDQISLKDELDREVAKMSFEPKEPWPDNDETAKTIEMLSANADYHQAQNWSLACPGGSPGLPPQDCLNDFGLVFSEINYKSNNNFDSDDWLEILNKSNNPINLSHWIFRDGNMEHKFIFPNGTTINAKQKIVLAMDTTKYFEYHATNENIYGPIDFSLSAKGESISLYNQFDLLISELTYDNKYPWPEDVGGTGYTIELADTTLDMTNGENWISSCFLGTPLKSPESCIHPEDIIISEIKYQSDLESNTGDWIELYNTSENDIPIYQWKLIHNTDTLTIDSNYVLNPNAYITLSADTSLFYQIYPAEIPSIKMLNFDLQKEEDALFILNPYKQTGNYLSYHHLLNWPVFDVDTNNRTLELLNYTDIYDPLNWRSSCEFGTPSSSPADCSTDNIKSISNGNYQLSLHPLPCRDVINIEFLLSKNENIVISIINLQLNINFTKNYGHLMAGKQKIQINLQSLPSGIYILQVQGENATERQKIIKIQ